ncbi:MAG: hypothetical protein RLY93_17595 [Sumerlaeia bacterium]
MTPAADTMLLIIDPQRDFCHPRGSLFVPGAPEDLERLTALLDRRGADIDTVAVTLDSHQLLDVGHPLFWRDPLGNRPEPFTTIRHEDVAEGRWTPYDPALRPRMLEYTRLLKTHGRYDLTIWPPHCLIGTEGHAIAEPLQGALRRWVEARQRPITFIPKGANIHTEHYSAIQADVPDPADPATGRNTALLEAIRAAGSVAIAGQALSHCVANTVRDIVGALPAEEHGKLHLLRDTTSPVPGFDAQAEWFLGEAAAAGVRVVTAADWP